MGPIGPILFDPDDNAAIQFDWNEFLTGSLTLSSVAHTVALPLVKQAESTDTNAGTSAIRISGAQHGGLYMVTAEATLSNGEKINRQYPIRGWNS